MNLNLLARKDEYGTPDEYLDIILPHLKNAVWVDPFTLNSTNRIVKYWRKNKIKHVEYSGDFFQYNVPPGVFVWSNPPYSIKKKVVVKLLKDGVKFLLLVPLQTVATKYATELLKSGDLKMILLSDRWPFFSGCKQMAHKPPFGLIYIHNLPWDLPSII